jgi:transposase-like protein
MREELEQCIGASWGEYTPTRRGYRNGSYTRDLVTTTGCIKDLKVPRDREGVFQTQAFERYQRYEPEFVEALTQMFVSGVSTHDIGKVLEALTGVAPSANAVSRLNTTLTCAQQVDLVVTDGHDGLLAALTALFPSTPLQRCLVHKQRNVMSSIPKREQQEVHTAFLDAPFVLSQRHSFARAFCVCSSLTPVSDCFYPIQREFAIVSATVVSSCRRKRRHHDGSDACDAAIARQARNDL